MRILRKFAILLSALAIMGAASQPAPAQLTLTKITVVNMTPNNQSGEKSHDSEPNLAVNPADVQKMAATAFTPNHDGGSNAPIYISTDGGQTWQLSYILPFNHPVTGTGDITLRFGSKSEVLYIAALQKPLTGSRKLKILRTKVFTSPIVVDLLQDRESVDMPYVQAVTTVSSTGVSTDRVYVGYIDRHSTASTGAAPGTYDIHATVEVSLDAANTPTYPSSDFVQKRIDVRGSCDGSPKGPVSPAVHSDGRIYAAFFRLTTCSGLYKGDVVVVRDDNWGAAFAALIEPSAPPSTVDGQAGIRIAQGVSVPYGTFLGNQRLGGQISIAVDPSNKDRVFVAWADGAGGTDYTIRVRGSTDGGATWSGDLWTVKPATNPSLAINDQGKVGLLYQKYVVDTATGEKNWETWLDRSRDGFSTDPQQLRLHKGLDFDPGTDPLSGDPLVPAGPIGDFLHLLAVKRDFYGVFSGHNAPDLDNFDFGVQYQRNHDFATKTLFKNDNVTPVEKLSSDPFFFVVSEKVIPDPCVRRPSLCGSRSKMARGLINLKCLTHGCTVLDFLPKNCLVKFTCPGCTARGLCPPYYHVFLYGLKDAWRVSIHDSAGNPVKHRSLSTRTGSVISFRPTKENFVEGQIGNYLLAFEMQPQGKVGTDYKVKTRLVRSNRHFEPPTRTVAAGPR